ncbi:MAG: hypothetical protein GY754_32485 [bacterium]|nr:hypothetical protein [bacterium]
MSEFVSVIFCRSCGSRFVEISEWTSDNKGIIHCRTCDKKEEVGNFTLGRCRVKQNSLEEARMTAAKLNKYEK